MASLRRGLLAGVMLVFIVLVGALLPIVSGERVADAQAPPVVISEFLAANDNSIVDNTGAFTDWIELHNTSAALVDLDGWVIADSGVAFTFPGGTSLPAGGYLVVFASDDVNRTTPSEIHLPFKLSSGGESLSLLDPVGTVSSPSWIAPASFPPQIADTSYGVGAGGTLQFFSSPTPGADNSSGVAGVVDAVEFSLQHGFYSSNQTLVLDTATSSATIRYTTNGSVPSATNGVTLSPGNSISVSQTSTIRAVAYRSGWITSPVETRTYLFANDIVEQGQPAGWPTGPVNDQRLDYGMDPDVVNGNAAAVAASLQAIPTISIVTDVDNLFDPVSGMYVNAASRGAAWERQASVELIDPTGAEAGFDIEAGLRIRGGFSRIAANPKHAFRLFFGNDYEGALDYPLFGAEGDNRFEKVDLRTSSNYAWSWLHATDASFIDEVWSRDTQGAMGQPYTRSRQYHLYLNGTYWGLYMSQERVSGEYGESYFGGAEDDYDVVKRNAPSFNIEATNGTLDAWNSFYPLVSDLAVTPTEYDQIASQVDLVNLADYYLLHFWTGDYDGSPTWYSNGNWRASNNWYGVRNRNGVGPAAKWKFFDHDSEHSLCANGGPRLGVNIDNTPPWNQVGIGIELMGPGMLHEALVTNATYRQIFADRVNLHMLTPGGALTVAQAEARLDVRVAEVSPAVEAESARWGDGGGAPAYGRTQWETGVQRLRGCFSQRESIVEDQLRNDGLWPSGSAPTMSPVAGAIPFGTTVAVNSGGQAGTLWYTTDGADPRNVAGEPSASAAQYTGPIAVTGDVTIKARILSSGQWTPIAESVYTLSTLPGPAPMVLNEFNAVSSSSFLGGGSVSDSANGADATFGRLAGNGGDWFELVVIQDGLDIRGWTAEVWNLDNGVLTRDAALTFTDDAALSDLLAGSILTVSESIADDVSYDPLRGDWHINVQSNSTLSGAFITSSSQANFAINNDNTQIALFDQNGVPVQLRTGEGTVPGVAVGSTEVFKLEGTPSGTLTPDSSLYAEGSTSTWGLPNGFNDGLDAQDLSGLRVLFGDVNCDATLNVLDPLIIAQFGAGLRTATTTCPLSDPVTQIYVSAGDVTDDGQVTVIDALVLSQCSVGLQNEFCP